MEAEVVRAAIAAVRAAHGGSLTHVPSPGDGQLGSDSVVRGTARHVLLVSVREKYM